jgi:hypothetical protein
MAFRNSNPNALSPILSDDSTWSTVVVNNKKKNKVRPAAAKENYGIPRKDLGTLLAECEADTENASRLSNKEATTWRRSNDNIAHPAAFPMDKAPHGTDCRASGTPRVFPYIFNDDIGSDNKVNQAWNEVDASNTALQNPTSASKVIQRPSPSSNARRTPLPPGKEGDKHNPRFAETAMVKPPPGMIRVVPGPDAFQMETLKPSLPETQPAVPTQRATTMRALAAPPTATHTKMDYSAAARSFLPTPQAKKTIPPFFIYADRGPEPPPTQPPPPRTAMDSLEKYGRHLYGLSERAEPGSAEQAESILRSMIVNYKNGETRIQPDGACYNRCVQSITTRGSIPVSACTVSKLTPLFSSPKRHSCLREGWLSPQSRSRRAPHVYGLSERKQNGRAECSLFDE